MATIPITKRGAEKLKSELHRLKTKDRPEVINAIAEARAQGDLSENAEYDAAREEQGLVETRIAEVEDILMNAEELKATTSGKVSLGTTVTLKNDEKEVTYTVVGPVEADPVNGKISDASPIGQALMGKAVGDTVTIATPKASTEYTITKLG